MLFYQVNLTPPGAKKDPCGELPFSGNWEGIHPLALPVRIDRIELEGGRAIVSEVKCGGVIGFTGRLITFRPLVWLPEQRLKVSVEAPRVKMKILPVDLIIHIDETSCL